MDPCYLYAPKNEIEKAAIELVENFRYCFLDVILKISFLLSWNPFFEIEIFYKNFVFRGVPHIANLGHGIYQDTDPDKLKVFIDTVHAASTKN